MTGPAAGMDRKQEQERAQRSARTRLLEQRTAGLERRTGRDHCAEMRGGGQEFRTGDRVRPLGGWAVAMQTQTQGKEAGSAAAHPLAELLACPPETGRMLSAAVQSIEFQSGATIFSQGQESRGLYVVVAGDLQRRTERLDTRLTLGTVRVGDLVELAAVLGEKRHTYTLKALSGGTLLLFPQEILEAAFKAYPALRMQLLEELAREVSRAYDACFSLRMAGMRRRKTESGFPSGAQGTR